MSAPSIGLLTSRRFLALFVTQFLGAFNDNLFKNALVILIAFRLAGDTGVDAPVLITLAAGLFVAPFFLFSATAGQLADKLDKARMIRWVKAGEIGVMALAVVGFATSHVGLLLAVLFLMGAQSAFFGPLKYAILPVHLRRDELLAGNGLIEAATFLAILFGTLGGGLLVATEGGAMVVSAAVLVCAVLGWLASLAIPAAPAAAPGLRIARNPLTETFRVVALARENRPVFLSILGISWFWAAGAVYLSQVPTFAKEVLGGDETLVSAILATFSLGIGAGSLLAARLGKGEISARFVPLGALGMAVFGADLAIASLGGAPSTFRVFFDFFALAVAGGLYIVPLYALMQVGADDASRARIVAANNILNAAFVVAASAVAAALLAAGSTVAGVFLVLAVAGAGVAAWICRLLPDAVLRGVLRAVLGLLYRVEVRGLENLEKAGPRRVLVVNHLSYLDGLLLGAFLPGRFVFALHTRFAKAWWMRPFLRLFDAFPMDPTNPMATKALIKKVRSGRPCVIFPEGRISVTGALMKVYDGPGLIAERAGADLIPVHIDGAQYTRFSRLGGKLRRRAFPKIVLSVAEPRRLDVEPGVGGRARRKAVGDALYDVMSEMAFEGRRRGRSLFRALLDARDVHGGKTVVLEDPERKPLDYDALIARALILGRRLGHLTKPGATVGVMLPNSSAAVVTFFALQAKGRVPAMLNFTAGAAALSSACQAAELETVVTARRFVEAAGLSEIVTTLEAVAEVIYLEDLATEIGLGAKLLGLIEGRLAGLMHRSRPGDAERPAAVLFTSGSEGTPKGVVLSHGNFEANRLQLAARLDFNPTDRVFNALPMFHSFGLTGGLLLPLLAGVGVFVYPSPLHYRVVPELVYDTNATVLFGTDTFLAGYARSAAAYDFRALRYVFAGAEKVRDETRRVWSDRFGLRILEGYGATETAPVIAVNTSMHFKAGSVGRLMPGIAHRLEPVPGIARGGRLMVKGPNVMLGYLRTEAPGRLDAPEDGWYDTGDIVEIDAEGFVTIVGRAKRFAKIAGEMVSLGAVEDRAAALWPDARHAVVGVDDPRKGEKLVLVTDRPDATRPEFLSHAQATGLPELMVPREVVVVDALPVLGTGKLDYAGIGELVKAA